MNGGQTNVATLADLLGETAERHHLYEKSAPEHNWSDWYAAYLHARVEGSTSEEASGAAAQYVDSLG